MKRLISRIVDVKPGEGRAVLWSFLYFFLLLGAYYVLRPLRDNAGISGGVGNLPWLFTATFVTMLVAVPIYGFVVARLPRRRFIPLVYAFFVANIALFWLLLTLQIDQPLVARVFFVWLSVFNVFVVSVFWSYLADLFRSDQGKRLYGFIAAGGSIGAIAGPALTKWLIDPLGPVNLFLVAALLLLGAVFSATQLERASMSFGQARADAAITRKPMGGGSLAGVIEILRSRYLSGIALWVILLSFAGTVLYLIQADVVHVASADERQRVQIFATIDFWVGALSFLLQFLVTGKLIVRFGVGAAVAFLPLVFLLGYGVLAAMPVLMAVVVFQTLQRTSNFVISNPAREILFTVAEREEKYKAKNIIDGLVFRGADASWAWVYNQLHAVMGFGVVALALVMMVASAPWLILGVALGRGQEARAKLQGAGM
jgi:AAA family ATP:ADP antiporter